MRLAGWTLCLLFVVTGAKEVTIPDLGTVEGTTAFSAWTNRTIYQYQGIPYAQPPVGSLRFKRPVEFQGNWSTPFKADTFGPVCPQDNGVPPEKGHQDEDCLYINIYSPNTNGDGKRNKMPVLLYIHGGSFRVGSSRNVLPNFLLEEDVVLAVPQYRLGPFGFLSLKTDDVPGNQGMLDVLLALEWVHKYIEYFGGDPNRVTAFGQSAGATAASLLLLSPMLKEGVLHQVIVQGSGIGPGLLDADPVPHAKTMAAYAGCTESTMSKLTKCLLSLSTKQMLDAHTKYRADRLGGGNHVVWNEAGPESFLLNDPYILMQEGNFRHLPLMGGINKHECSFCVADIYDMVNAMNLTTDEEFLSRDLTRLTMEYSGIQDRTGMAANIFRDDYFTKSDLKDFNKMVPGLMDISAVAGIKAPLFTIVSEMSRTTPSYLYSFNFFGRYTTYGYFSTFGLNPAKWTYPFPPGVAHADELLYLFPQDYAQFNEEETAVAKKMVQLWTSFAANGIPRAVGVPTWPKVTTIRGPYMKIDKNPSVHDNFMDEFSIAVKEGLTPVPSSAPRLSLSALLLAPFMMFQRYISSQQRTT